MRSVSRVVTICVILLVTGNVTLLHVSVFLMIQSYIVEMPF